MQQSTDEFLLTDGEGKSIVSSGSARRTDIWKTSEIYIAWKSVLSSDDSNYFHNELQKKAEEVVEASEIKKGGVVLLDVKKNEILAMVSKPSVQVKDESLYIKLHLKNQMLTPALSQFCF